MMYAAYERATVACSILSQPTVNAITKTVGAPAALLTGRMVTPLQPLTDPEQMAGLESYRNVRVGYVFAADDEDWADLKAVDEGMVLRLTAANENWIIRRVDVWERPFADFQQRHKYLALMVERVKVDA